MKGGGGVGGRGGVVKLHQNPPSKDIRFFYSKNLERVLRAEPLCREDCQIFKIFRRLPNFFFGTREFFKTLSASYEELKKRCPLGGGDFDVFIEKIFC